MSCLSGTTASSTLLGEDCDHRIPVLEVDCDRAVSCLWDQMGQVKLWVGGKPFSTSFESLSKFPETLLGKLVPRRNNNGGQTEEFHYDRDPVIFSCILNMYRISELHLPSNLCGNSIKRELEFWEIPTSYVSDCCWRTMYQVEQDESIGRDLKANMDEKIATVDTTSSFGKIRQTLWLVLDQPNSSKVAKAWNVIFMCLVATSAVLYCLETIPELHVLKPSLLEEQEYAALRKNLSNNNTKMELLMFTSVVPAVRYIDIVCLCTFTVELLLHFATCPCKKMFMKRFLTWVDIITVLGGWCVFITSMGFQFKYVPSTHDMFMMYIVFRNFYIFRLFRFLRLQERFTGLKVIFLAINQSKPELLLLIFCFTILATIFGSIQFHCEFNNNKFSSIPISIWWAVVTMTTVGYGDYVPTGVCGYVVGSICSLFGLLVIPMPIAIIAANFNDYYRRNKNRQRQRKKIHKAARQQKSRARHQVHIKHPEMKAMTTLDMFSRH